MREPSEAAAQQRELQDLRAAGLSFVPQLRAAVERHDECDNWATLDTVLIAAKAVTGDPLCQEILSGEASWQLDAEGRLP